MEKITKLRITKLRITNYENTNYELRFDSYRIKNYTKGITLWRIIPKGSQCGECRFDSYRKCSRQINDTLLRGFEYQQLVC